MASLNSPSGARSPVTRLIPRNNTSSPFSNCAVLQAWPQGGREDRVRLLFYFQENLLTGPAGSLVHSSNDPSYSFTFLYPSS